MTCGHRQIRTWVFEDTQQPSGLWSCVDCGLKFEPITQRTWVGLTDDELIATYESEQQGRWGDHVRGLRAVEEAAHGIKE